MKHTFLAAVVFILFYQISYSQRSTCFAITGHGKGDMNWTDIRSIDLSTGNATSSLFENGKTKFSFINAETRQPVDKGMLRLPSAISEKINTNIPIQASAINPSPTELTSAAMAYDQRHGKLFFASMRTGSLIWLDMNSEAAAPVFYTISKPLVNNNRDFNDQAVNITRMTIGANGMGYALTNDANHLISFTTGSKVMITDLGNIVDADSNNGISVQNQCSSWGGDMVADASGKLILFTAAHQVFEIDPDSRVATYKGAVLNLPATFSLNGAAVDKDGTVVVSSGNGAGGFYRVNMRDLSSVKLPGTGEIFTASDLASSYLLNQSDATMNTLTLPPVDVIGNSFITIYPNPVSNGQIKISFENKVFGEYKIELTDLQGQLVDYVKVYVKSGGQVENFKLHSKLVRGLYLIKITAVDKKIIYSDKLLIE
jgi:hypothetical protein